MKYYLSYHQNGKYTPVMDDNIGSTLPKLVDFTTSFSNIKELKEYLYTNRLIPSKSVRIDYTIQKGSKKDREYKNIDTTDKIYTAESKSFFEIKQIKKRLLEEATNTEFIVFLIYQYLKKLGFLRRIEYFFYGLELPNLITILKEARKNYLSDETQKIIDKIIQYYEEDINPDKIEEYVDDFTRAYYNNMYDVLNLYILTRKYTQFINIPTINNLLKWLNASEAGNNVKKVISFSPHDVVDITILINDFFNGIAYYFDFAKKEYKMENSEKKKNLRNLFDLGVYLEEYYTSLYREYISLLEECNIKESQIDESDVYQYAKNPEDGDDEEFLCADDFERVGTDPEEAGYQRRRY